MSIGIYHIINWPFISSLLEYLSECVVLTYESRTPAINRGFGHEPFCIIYGFGALGAVALLTSLTDNSMKLYIASMVTATTMELVTTFMMVRLFGSLWWDYDKKPLSYRGVICLESSLAWGSLGTIFFQFLNGFVHHLIGHISENLGKKIAVGLVVFYLVDFAYAMREQMRENKDEEAETMIGRLKLY